ncbi:hypothetical protein SCP_0406040 [Sparassis crispa]|uniref:Uncharacterized protein n=1 Tax=Sparassis crispa TaxID=139825 RepID=A0A401GJ97_9APHY|nr:hypothetical protein SCP_0406040 [Sparassis crispa]GBE82221.1 hypothetical protein SCP_0406040 [Sparassis crispa]
MSWRWRQDGRVFDTLRSNLAVHAALEVITLSRPIRDLDPFVGINDILHLKHASNNVGYAEPLVEAGRNAKMIWVWVCWTFVELTGFDLLVPHTSSPSI